MPPHSKKKRRVPSVQGDIISSGLEVLLRLERAADRAERTGKAFPSLPENDPRQKSVQRFVFNALQWIAEESRNRQAEEIMPRQEHQQWLGSEEESRNNNNDDDNNNNNNCNDDDDNNNNDNTTTTNNTNDDNNNDTNSGHILNVPTRKNKQKKMKSRRKRKSPTRARSPKLMQRQRNRKAKSLENLEKMLPPVSPVKKVSRADIERLSTRQHRRNPYAEQLEKEFAQTKGKKVFLKDIKEKLKIFSRPKRVTKPYLSLQSQIPLNERRKHAFGISGDRFVGESIYKTNSTPGPGAYSDVSKSTLDGSSVKMATYVPMNPLDLLMLQSSRTPGPADYTPKMPRASGGKFSTANPPDHITLIQREASKTPGPNQYKMPSLGDNIKGGKMANYVPVHPIDLLMERASRTPGPGQYGIPELPKKEGVRFSTASPSDSFDRLIAKAKRSPGPGHYDPQRGYDYVEPIRTTTFPNFDPPNALDVLVRRTSRLPGPGQYDSLSPVKYGKVSNSLTSMMRKDPVF